MGESRTAVQDHVQLPPDGKSMPPSGPAALPGTFPMGGLPLYLSLSLSIYIYIYIYIMYMYIHMIY